MERSFASDPRGTRRRIRSLPAVAGDRRGRGGPATPSGAASPWRDVAGAKPHRDHRNAAREAPPPVVAVSARKLAAAWLWRLQAVEPNLSAHATNLSNHNEGILSIAKNDSPISAHYTKPDISLKIHACSSPTSIMESATKFDATWSKSLYMAACQFKSHHKLLEDEQDAETIIVSSLEAELELARTRISKLEDQKRSEMKKLDRFMRKLAEEKAVWRIREHEKIREVIHSIKSDASRERKSRQRLEAMNCKLVDELAEVKLSANRYLQDYEKERKARELMEEVCDELSKEVGEDKAKVEALRRESMKIREEMEEERRMLQMAEVWREERVQMKLIDAKLTLEHKHSEMSKLLVDLEYFLRVHCDDDGDKGALREAKILKEAAMSMKIHGIKEFYYQPPRASEDIFSVIEELRPREDTNEREMDQGHASMIKAASPETDILLEEPIKQYLSGILSRNGVVENDSGNSSGRSDPSVNGNFRESNASVSGRDCDDTGESNSKLHSDVTDVCSVTERQSRTKRSSVMRFWRPSNAESCNNMEEKLYNRVSSTGNKSNATPSLDSSNLHVAQASKGCAERLQSMPKRGLKAKLFEARTDTQKVQLRQVLEHQI